MAYKELWWHNNIEYGAGVNKTQTWPQVMEQYRRPNLRYYDPPLPTETYSTNMLYYERPRLGKPVYRGTFRDKPHTVTSYYPQRVEDKPIGFHGRVYYEHGLPKFKYNGPPKDSLYWLEKPEYLPYFPRQNSTVGKYEDNRGLNMPPTPTSLSSPGGMRASVQGSKVMMSRPDSTASTVLPGSSLKSGGSDRRSRLSDRLTMDGVGYL